MQLQERLNPICHRTLRRQVLEYTRYTNRIPITQEFVPTEEEQILYDMVSDYLQRPSLNALPSSQRTLMTLIMRKLLASSSLAIAGALDSLARKLERKLKEDREHKQNLKEEEDVEITADFDSFEEEAEEWVDDEDDPELLNPEDIIAIEQRIGRCHRYGQQHDVLVINFLNKNNAADRRVYELLSEKFHLFSGVFGASNEVLGAVESGVEFEKRIVGIYQNCQTTEEIESAFERLQEKMAARIDETMQNTRKKLLENFDAEVHDRLKVNLDEATEYVNRYERMLWTVTKHELKAQADFDDGYLSFLLKRPVNSVDTPTGAYHLTKKGLEGHHCRLDHPLAQCAVIQAGTRALTGAHITFDYSAWPQTAANIEPLIGKSGTLTAHKLFITGIDAQDHIIYSGFADDGTEVKPRAAARLFELPVISHEANAIEPDEKLLSGIKARKQKILEELAATQSEWFDDEMDKLDNWAQDKRTGLKTDFKDYDDQIKELKKQENRSSRPATCRTSWRCKTRSAIWNKNVKRRGAPMMTPPRILKNRRTHFWTRLKAGCNRMCRKNIYSPFGGRLNKGTVYGR